MMETILATGGSYVLGVFLLSAALVRWAPNSYCARQIRRQFKLFLILPVLLIFECIHLIDATCRLSSRLLRKSFEALSGKSLLDDEGRGYVSVTPNTFRAKRHRRRSRQHNLLGTRDELLTKARS